MAVFLGLSEIILVVKPLTQCLAYTQLSTLAIITVFLHWPSAIQRLKRGDPGSVRVQGLWMNGTALLKGAFLFSQSAKLIKCPPTRVSLCTGCVMASSLSNILVELQCVHITPLSSSICFPASVGKYCTKSSRSSPRASEWQDRWCVGHSLSCSDYIELGCCWIHGWRFIEKLFTICEACELYFCDI
jgi:hypothetical protein